LGVPWITIRENAESPVTVDLGKQYMVGTDPSKNCGAASAVRMRLGKKGEMLEMWDGR